MTGIEKTVTNRSGAGVLVLCAILFCLCACTEDASYTAGVWYRRSDFDGVARTDAPVSRLATKDISVEVTTGKQPVWPIPGSMTSTMTGGRNVPICPVRFGMPLQVSRWGIKGTSLPVTIPIRSIWPIRGSTIRRQIPGGKWMTSKGEPLLCPWVWH